MWQQRQRCRGMQLQAGGGGRGKDCQQMPEARREVWDLGFRLLALRRVQEQICIDSSCRVCGDLLQQLQEANTQALHNAYSRLQRVRDLALTVKG